MRANARLGIVAGVALRLSGAKEKADYTPVVLRTGLTTPPAAMLEDVHKRHLPHQADVLLADVGEELRFSGYGAGSQLKRLGPPGIVTCDGALLRAVHHVPLD